MTALSVLWVSHPLFSSKSNTRSASLSVRRQVHSSWNPSCDFQGGRERGQSWASSSRKRYYLLQCVFRRVPLLLVVPLGPSLCLCSHSRVQSSLSPLCPVFFRAFLAPSLPLEGGFPLAFGAEAVPLGFVPAFRLMLSVVLLPLRSLVAALLVFLPVAFRPHWLIGLTRVVLVRLGLFLPRFFRGFGLLAGLGAVLHLPRQGEGELESSSFYPLTRGIRWCRLGRDPRG